MSFRRQVVGAGAGGVVAWGRRPVLWVALALGWALFPAGALAAPYDTLVSSRSSGEGPPDAVGTGESGPSGTAVTAYPVISASGRYVAFASSAPNLVPGDTNTSADVFVRDHGSSPPTTTIVSRASDTMGVPGVQSNDTSYPTSMSPTGRYVVFTSRASNLAAGDGPGSAGQASRDVFVRDRDPDGDGVFDEGDSTTALVSAKPDGKPANRGSDEGSISADGRYVAFSSEATDLVAGGTKGGVFVRDLVAKTTTAVSRPDGPGPSEEGGREPSISADGRYVAFVSGGDVFAGGSNTVLDVFVRDLVARTTRLVSRADSGAERDRSSVRPSISGSGRFVAFDSQASNLVDGDVNGKTDVFVRDLRAGTLRLVSRASDSGGAPGAAGNGYSQNPSISGDGRFVAFHSSSANLVAANGNGSNQVFVRDSQEGATVLASRASGQAGAPANNGSFVPVLASGGGFVAFLSTASNLVTADLNGITDVFRRELGPVPAVPSVSVGDVSVAEGDAGEVDARFVVSLSRAVGQAVVVDFTTANDSASAGEDYVSGNGSVVIPAGQTSGVAVVKVKGDTLDEPDERFFVNLTGPQGASVADGQGVGTIVDDDEVPGVSVGDVSVSEGDVGEVDATFAVSLSGPSGRAVSVAFATADDTAVAPGDYTAASGTVTFAAGETSKTVTVKVKGDLVSEPVERFFVRLSNPQGVAVVDGEGVGTIADNDAAGPDPRVSISDATVTEGDSGVVQASFEVSLSATSGSDVVVAFATANDSATAPADYEAKSGSVTIPAGQTTRTVSVAVAGDRLDEPDERFFVNLSGPQGATVGDGQGAGMITDDDAPPAVSVADSAVTEGDGDDVVASFAVSLSAPSGRPVTVDYATVDDTAIAPGDYTPKSGSVTFAPGDVSETVSVAVRGDLLDEPDERFVVRLANPVAASVGDGEGAATIADNDAPPALGIGDVTVVEGDGGARDALFTVSLSAPSGRPVSVDLATGDDSAIAPGDYEPRTATVVFAAGETTKSVAVKVKGDVLDEPDERFFVNLLNPANATVADGQGIGTITDDDPPPTRSDGGGAPAGGGGPGGAPGGGAPAGGGARPGLRPGAPGTRCGDLTRPRSSVSKRSQLTRKRIGLTGRTTDRECSAEGKVIRTERRLARVELSIVTRAGKRCRYLTASGALSAPRSCARPLFVRAQMVSFDRKQAKTAWRLAQRVKLPRGRYTVYVRGVDRDGNIERAKRRSNRATFKVQ